MKKILFGLLLIPSLFSCSKDDDKAPSENNNNEETPINEMLTYSNIELSKDFENVAIGSFFSTATGKVYLDSEVNAETGPKIDIVFGSMANIMGYFVSPTSAKKEGFMEIPGATTSLFTNYITTEMAANDFDTLTWETLDGLTVTEDSESFSLSSGFPHLVWFQNAQGKKGVIRVKQALSQKIVIDIKVQK